MPIHVHVCLCCVQMMGVNLRGELSVVTSEDTNLLDFSLIEKMADAMRLSSKEVAQPLNVQTIKPKWEI